MRVASLFFNPPGCIVYTVHIQYYLASKVSAQSALRSTDGVSCATISAAINYLFENCLRM